VQDEGGRYGSLDFCDHGILTETETTGLDQVKEAWERMKKNDVHYRFVIDMSRGL
jgi:alcohol dehydrogenase (NADP+)